VSAKETNILSLSAPMSRQVYIVFLLLLLGFSCKKPEDRSCFKGSGTWTSEERSFPGLTSVRLFDYIDYNFIQDSADKVVIRAGENLLSHIDTEFDQGVLTIRNENKCNWLRALPVSIEVDIHFKELDLVYNESAGTSRTVGVWRQESFTWQNWHTASKSYLELEVEQGLISTNAGGSLIELVGSVNYVDLYLSGVCQIKAKNLIASSAFAHNVGSGDIELTVIGGTLYWNIESHGNIIYHGNPEPIIEYGHTGGGELIKGG
jgi:hypothetical protein